MLVGKMMTLDEFIETLKEKIEEKRMEVRSISSNLQEENSKFNKMPRIKNEPPTEEMAALVSSIKEKQNRIAELEEKIELFKAKIEEGEQAKNPKQTVYFSLTDCILFEV